MKRALRSVLVLVVILSVLFLAIPAYATTAVDITKNCTITVNSNAGKAKLIYDGSPSTIWTGTKSRNQKIDISVNIKTGMGGFYFKWNTVPPKYDLYGIDGRGKKKLAASGQSKGYLTEFVAVPRDMAAYRHFLFVSTDSSSVFSISELYVYSSGALPYYVPQWQPYPARADILLFAAHPDDEQLYLGPVMPTYYQQGYSTETVFMTYGNRPTSQRRYEAMESVWSTGERSYPIVRNAPDVKTVTKEQAMRYWPLKQTEAFMVEQIRRFKPSIIVTHDIMGEYWHGAHRETSYVAQLAFAAAADPKQFPDSARKYGAWKAGKLYLHLYGKNMITLNDKIGLPAFGNRTVYEVEMSGYVRHISQDGGQPCGRALRDDGPYSNIQFGLFASNVGMDRYHETMFENISDAVMQKLNPKTYPKPSTTPTQKPTPTPTPEPTPAPTPAPTQSPAPTPTSTPEPTPAPTDTPEATPDATASPAAMESPAATSMDG